MTDPVKVEIVGPVSTNTDNPWRTQGDYREDQRRQEKLYKLQSFTLVAAVLGLVVSSSFQLLASLQPPPKVEVQCITQQPTAPAADKAKDESSAQTQQQRKAQPNQ